MKATARTSLVALVAWAVLAVVAATPASAKQYRFVGPHPIPGKKGAWCYIQAPHVHIYAPAHVDVEYRDYDGWNYFVGDPVPYGYDGPKYAYDGPHPIPVDVTVGVGITQPQDVEYCYIRGPHFHYYRPALPHAYVLKGGIYWYTGPFPARFKAEIPRYVRINAIYKPLTYPRPVVEVSPPPAYKDVLVLEAPTPAVEVEAPAARIVAPGRPHVGGHLRVDVAVPVPSVEVRVGGGVHIGGGVFVGPGGPHHPHPHGHWERRGRGHGHHHHH